MELEIRILLWLFITVATGAIGGLSWFVLKRVLFPRDRFGALHHIAPGVSSLPPNGGRQDEEAWLKDLRGRVSELEVKRESQGRVLAAQGRMLEDHEQELNEQNAKMQALRELFRIHNKSPEV